jgi:hypothetical protein
MGFAKQSCLEKLADWHPPDLSAELGKRLSDDDGCESDTHVTIAGGSCAGRAAALELWIPLKFNGMCYESDSIDGVVRTHWGLSPDKLILFSINMRFAP